MIKGIVILLLLGWLFLKIINLGAANRRYRKGRDLEEKSDFKSACYEYALAIAEGCSARSDCIERLRVVWRTYGPFSYENKKKELEDEIEKIREGVEEDSSGCGKAGCSLALAECLDATEVIRQVVSGADRITLPRSRTV